MEDIVNHSRMENCIGLISIVFIIFAYIAQFYKSGTTLDMSSFSIASLLLMSVGQFLSVIQAMYLGSRTMVWNRSIILLAEVMYIGLWFVADNK